MYAARFLVEVKSTSMKRRTLLKSAGVAGVALSGVPPVSGGPAESFEELYQEALRIRDETGSYDRFVSHLETNGASIQNQHQTDEVDLSHPDPGELQPDKFEKAELSTTMTLTYNDCDDAWYVDYEFSINEIDFNDAGDPQPDGSGGPDQISIGCHHNHWYVDENDWYSGGLDNLSQSESTLYGVTFEWKDGKSCYYGCDSTGYVGTRLTPFSTDETRVVRGEYNHTWNGLTLSGLSVDSDGGVSFGTKDTSRSWESGVQVLTEDETRYTCTGP